MRALAPVRLACIGPKTADALRAFHLEPDLVPTRFQSEDLAAALRQVIQPGDRVLLARADRGRDVLRAELSEICTVEQIAVYSQIDAPEFDEHILASLRRGEIELVSISPVTSAAVRELGFEVAGEATEATTEGLLAALVARAAR